MKRDTVKDIILDALSIWSNVTSLIFQEAKSQDADITLSFWDLGEKLTWEEGYGVPGKGLIVSVCRQKPSPANPTSEKKNPAKS